jgi:glycine oxidase
VNDVVVVGAGVIGLLAARELAAAGAGVVVLDRSRPARESSWAGGGILSPLYPWRYPAPVNRLAQWSQGIYRELCDSLRDSSGIDPEWIPSGMLVVDIDDRESIERWAAAFSMRFEYIDTRTVRELEPELGLEPDLALWLPEVAQVRNPRLVKALLESLQRTGVEIRPDSPVQGWRTSGDRVTAVQTPSGELHADNFVAASGAWTAGVLESTGLRLPFQPVRGQMLLFRGEPDRVRRISLYRGRYVIPRRDGRVLVGSTLEFVGFDKHTTDEALADLRQSAFELVPALVELPMERHWAGLRPGSPDGVPMIGPHPALTNLYICTGHFRNGVVLGPASARLLADQLLGRPPILDTSPYLADKFMKS